MKQALLNTLVFYAITAGIAYGGYKVLRIKLQKKWEFLTPDQRYWLTKVGLTPENL